MILQFLKRIKNWVSNYLLERKFNKEVTENINLYFNNSEIYHLVQEDVEKKYHNGLLLVKRKIKEKVDEGYTYEEVLKMLGDSLIALANQEKDQKIELLKNIYIYESRDIKSEEDKIKMIDKRIADYKQLHKHVEKRKLARDLRAAERAGDTKLVDQLTKEWKQKYG